MPSPSTPFAWVEQQAGALFAIGPQTLGVDLLDLPDTTRNMFPKLLRSYALDAVETVRSTPASGADAAAFLAPVAGATPMTLPAIGLGKDVRLTGDGVSGAGPVGRNRSISTSAHSRPKEAAPPGWDRGSAVSPAGARDNGPPGVFDNRGAIV